MIEYTLTPATKEHALELAPRMRLEDKWGAEALANYTPMMAVLTSLKQSPNPQTILAGEEVIFMIGVAEYPEIPAGSGMVWGMGRYDIPSHARPFLRITKSYIKEIGQHYDLLFALVDARYTASIRWIEWLGFDVAPAAPWGDNHLAFHLSSLGDG